MAVASARYARQLVAHLSRKAAFTTSDDGSMSTMTIGDTRGQVVVGGVLTLVVEAQLEVTWARTSAASA